MNESEARRKFRTVLQHCGFDEEVKDIIFCENRLDGHFGKLDTVFEYYIYLDQTLLVDPEKLDREWTNMLALFPDNVVHSLPKNDRIFLVFLHELGHIINGDGLEDSPENTKEERRQEQAAWDVAWTIYRAYRAGEEQAD